MFAAENVDERELLKQKSFLKSIKRKRFADKVYVKQDLFEILFAVGSGLMTEVKSNMKNSLMSVEDKILRWKKAPSGLNG